MSSFNKDIAYNNLANLPPKIEFETKTVLQKTISASRALAQLNGAIRNLPNPSLFLDTIHLQEAKASSEIENILTTNDDIYQSLVAEKKFSNPATKEVLNYKDALWIGLQRLEEKPFITTNLCVEIAQCIKQNSASIRNTPGTTLKNSKGEVIYTPPVGEGVIREKLSSLETFINTDSSLDPLIKMALTHYQFEAIHPFADGNGRTGRILLLLQLKLEKLLDVPAIYLSEYIIHHKNEYYERLRAVTEKNDWEGFILYMLDMIENTSLKGIKRLEEVMALINSFSLEVKEKIPKIYSKELIEILFRLPYTKRKFLVDAKLGTAKTVGKYLMSLEKNGFLKSYLVGKEKLYLNDRLMQALNGTNT